jgi:tetratricopeptide (TPR) repeat protein
MTEPSPSERESLPPASDAIDAVCDQFEQAWIAARAGTPRPCIDDHLDEVPPEDHTRLVRELVLLELFYRVRAGEQPRVEDYLGRFAELDALWLEAKILQELAALPPKAVTVGFSAGANDPDIVATPPPVSLAGNSIPTTRPPGTKECAEPPGRVDVPGYKVLRELGLGGMGVVYLARQVRLDRLVALKVVLGGGHAGTEERRRFQAEAEAVARLKHPHVVHVYEVGEHAGLPFFSMEYCEGGSLDAHLDGTPWQPVRAAALVQTLARAMHAAHQTGIVHRDLKPPNVLLTADGTPKITDFGLAKRLDLPGHTQTGAVVGTPSYMAPEQAAGKKGVGPAADVWALGAILYELLVGRPPFKAATPLDTVWQVLADEPVAVRRLQPKVPRDLETVCHKCLQKDPRMRYASAEALAEDLKCFLASEPIQARRVRPWERAAKWARRRPAAAAQVGILAAVGVALPIMGLQVADQRIRQAEQKRLDEARAEVRNLLAAGETAEKSLDWKEAARLLDAALQKIAAVPGLADLRKEVEPARARVGHRLKAIEAFEGFKRNRDDALFHATLASGEEFLTNLRMAQTKAQDALAAAGLSRTGEGTLTLDSSWTEQEKAEITSGSYALLLMLAEGGARRLPGEGEEQYLGRLGRALDLLNHAAELPVRTRVLHLRRARYLKLRGDAAGAAQELERAKALAAETDLDPQDHFLVGHEHYNRGDLEAANREFRRALQLKPGHFWTHYFLGICCIRAAKPEVAVAHFTVCQSQHSDLTWVYLLRGFALGQMQDYAAAEKDFGRALASPNLTATARYVLYNNRGVMRLGQKDKGAWEAGIEDLQKAAELRPGQYQAHASLAEAFGLRRQAEEAIKQVNEAITLAERQARDGALRPVKLALLHHSRARLHLQRKDPDAAVRDLTEAAHLAGNGPLGARAHADRGLVLHSQKHFDEALRAYDAALKINPAQVAVLRRRGEVLLALNRNAEAMQAFDEYLSQGGAASAALYHGRGTARFRLGKYHEAIDDFSLALAAGLKGKEMAELHLSRGLLYLNLNAAERALRDFQAVLKFDGANANAWRGCAQARLILRQPKEATSAAERAVGDKPMDPSLWLDASRVFAQSAGLLAAAQGPDDQLRWLGASYLHKAVTLLHQAMRRVEWGRQRAYWRDNVEKDKALEPLRDLPEFRFLAARYSRPNR